jgi:hypothetical protein
MPARPSRRWCSMCCDIHVAQINRQVARATCLRGLLTGEAFSVTYFFDRGLTDWVAPCGRSRPAGGDFRVLFEYGADDARPAEHQHAGGRSG